MARPTQSPSARPPRTLSRPARSQRWVLALGLLLCLDGVQAGWSATPSSRDQLGQTRRDLNQERGDLQDIRRQLQFERRQVRLRQQRERSLLSQLQQSERHIEEAEDRYGENQRNLVVVREHLRNIRAAMEQTEARLAEMRKLLAVRLRGWYREGQLGRWRILVTSQTLGEALTRMKFFHVLAAQNAYWVERLTISRHELAQQKMELASRETQVQELEGESRAVLEKIRTERETRTQMLKRVRTERTAHQAAAQELAAAAERLNALIGRLEQKARDLERRAREPGPRKRTSAGRAAERPAPAPLIQRRLPWPTRGRVITPYGKTHMPRFNTYVLNKGIDIAGPMGQNVIAVSSGRVLFAEWFEGYGRMVILDHGNGLNTIYAHLAKIMVSESQAVTEGQTIGALGDSGSWKGPCLYFEIRHRGEALNPLPWLSR